MTYPTRFLSPIRRRSIALLLMASVAAPSIASAQEIVAPTRTPTADALATHMRALASNPGDLRALIGAGEASAKLGDGAAAMQFFARAEKIDPRNPRIAAGRGSAMVAMERPGEALKYFAQAEQLGLRPIEYAADRGLAYDLMGYPDHAQADYRLALSRTSDDEVTRRLALSLGISGKREEAARLLDTMLRANDRQAWRVQAMVVAMDGDFATADRIAASMMPGFGPNLAPFFRRLPALSPGDRAFAGHFGQLQRTPQRVADASMAPPIGAATAPVALASATGAQPQQVAEQPRGRTQLAARPERQEPSSVRAAVVTDARQPVRTARRAPLLVPARPAASPPPQQLAAQQPPLAAPGAASTSAPAAMVQAVPQPSAPGVTLAGAADSGPIGARLSTDSRGVLSLTAPAAPAPSAAGTVAPATGIAPAASAQPGFGSGVAASATTSPATRRSSDTDAVLARIMSGITVPGSELNAAPSPPPAATPGASAPAPAPSPPPAATPGASAPAPAPSPPARTPAAPAEKPAARAEAKPAAATTARKPAAPAEPARHWVQVAGGARAADLHRDWDRLSKQSPDAFRGKQAWTTPLRATNRLLAGPFKTRAEAQTFVNRIAGDGISAFAWQSEAGQKIESLNR